jgi:RsiW-degrading membrane proteinase PrsW (M82 family)
MGRWLWLKILASGVVMFFLVEQAALTTGNINYIPSLLFVGTFTVPVSFLVLLYTRDKMPHISMATILACLLWGGILGTVLAGIVEYHTLLHLSVPSVFMVGLIEEAAKLAIPAGLILIRKQYTELDGIVIGAASGAGFAALESMGYGLVALLVSGGSLTTAAQVLMFRGLMAPAAHIAWTAIAAGAVWHLVHRTHGHALRDFVLTFLGVASLHAAWDSVASGDQITFLVLSLVSLGWLLIRVRQAGSQQSVV